MELLDLLQGMTSGKEEKQLPLPKDGEPGGQGEERGMVESAARPRAAPAGGNGPEQGVGWGKEKPMFGVGRDRPAN